MDFPLINDTMQRVLTKEVAFSTINQELYACLANQNSLSKLDQCTSFPHAVFCINTTFDNTSEISHYNGISLKSNNNV